MTILTTCLNPHDPTTVGRQMANATYQVRIYIEAFDEVIEPYVMKDSPNLLSMGSRCEYRGWGVRWRPGENGCKVTIPNKGHIFLKSEGHVPILNKNTGIASGISYSSGVMTGTQNSKQHTVGVGDVATSQPEPIDEDLFHSKTSEDETGEKSGGKETEASEEKTGEKSPIADKARKLSN